MDRSIGRVVRAVRLRLGWRQTDVAVKAGVSRATVARVERRGAAGVSLRALRRICDALEVELTVGGRWRGGELDRLLDAAHADLQSVFLLVLTRAGWEVRTEVTFSRYGERGSIDLLAWHAGTRMLLLVEVKSVIADVQGLLRPLDAKVRLAPTIAAELGWVARTVVPCLVVHDNSTARRRVSQHGPLFARFELRGRDATKWLRSPGTAPSGLLIFLNPPSDGQASAMRAGRQRVRLGTRRPRSSAGSNSAIRSSPATDGLTSTHNAQQASV